MASFQLKIIIPFDAMDTVAAREKSRLYIEGLQQRQCLPDGGISVKLQELRPSSPPLGIDLLMKGLPDEA